MKKWDVKTYITLLGAITLYIIVIGVTAVTCNILIMDKNADGIIQVFTIIFTLFTNIITAAITYFFTRKSIDSVHKEEEIKPVIIEEPILQSDFETASKNLEYIESKEEDGI